MPDAWDDDWDKVADTSAKSTAPVQPTVKLSRAERKAQHQELNKQLWNAAEQPERSYFLETKGATPLNSDFKPQVRLLSRRPTPQIANRMAGLNLEDEDDSEEEERKRQEASLAERQRKAAEERKEKERKYAEVRERLFGASDSSRDPSTSRTSSARGDRNSRRGNRGRGNRNGGTPRDSQSNSPADQSPARSIYQPNQLFDHTYEQKPRSIASPRPTGPRDEQPIRMPKGPDDSGRGGFGFAPRGGKTSP
ncbi:hypothetical protein D6C90_04531 [Aureobasidium pullulans]|uniref:Uncharacterized protein n=1 Tax=Aureobasidium pullulans TaxID=5580 RepID=A0A4S9N5W7_AURPU|nr:hypothetical protein D6C99_05810 [Aureobasidium pullulans]THY51450.1 hypothetical protein D6C97_06683 [Aureobasidium pullulans]THZ45391.1 hypothetical protein D6C90_04531 [Aureobasidium pullulans]